MDSSSTSSSIPINIECKETSRRGRKIFLLQMLMVCFIPHAALILQNCSIMSQLSSTMDASIFLNNKVSGILEHCDAVLAIQDERSAVTNYLLGDSNENENP
ncbi:unnamed protein product [Leptidea sinapis]|uniref:Uncharacterized protein n=1 Tax=Leptidea sinapis TaxID=189913 RepID=A0A5E4PZK4_9NEOP|nr:unnamed protein product [Leptidea sinapis]